MKDERQHMMRRNLTLFAVIAFAATTAAASSRTLTTSIEAAPLATVSVEAGVGDIDVTVGSDASVAVEVVLKPRRGGLFSSMRQAEAEVAAAELVEVIDGDVLRLRIRSTSDDRRFEERWTVRLPARLAVELDVGVGDVQIRGVAGGVQLDSGVGDADLEIPGGDVEISTGVGDISIRSVATAYGHVSGSGGVGDARIRVHGETLGKGGFVGSDASWRGDGPGTIETDAGVGDISVELD